MEEYSDLVLRYAVAGSVENVQQYCRYGVNPSTVKDIHGRTALHIAAQSGNLPVAQYLLSMGAPINEQDKFGCTPLHVLCASQIVPSHKLIAVAIARHGCDVLNLGLSDKCGRTVEMMLQEKGLLNFVLAAAMERLKKVDPCRRSVSPLVQSRPTEPTHYASGDLRAAEWSLRNRDIGDVVGDTEYLQSSPFNDRLVQDHSRVQSKTCLVPEVAGHTTSPVDIQNVYPRIAMRKPTCGIEMRKPTVGIEMRNPLDSGVSKALKPSSASTSASFAASESAITSSRKRGESTDVGDHAKDGKKRRTETCDIAPNAAQGHSNTDNEVTGATSRVAVRAAPRSTISYLPSQASTQLAIGRLESSSSNAAALHVPAKPSQLVSRQSSMQNSRPTLSKLSIRVPQGNTSDICLISSVGKVSPQIIQKVSIVTAENTNSLVPSKRGQADIDCSTNGESLDEYRSRTDSPNPSQTKDNHPKSISTTRGTATTPSANVSDRSTDASAKVRAAPKLNVENMNNREIKCSHAANEGDAVVIAESNWDQSAQKWRHIQGRCEKSDNLPEEIQKARKRIDELTKANESLKREKVDLANRLGSLKRAQEKLQSKFRGSEAEQKRKMAECLSLKKDKEEQQKKLQSTLESLTATRTELKQTETSLQNKIASLTKTCETLKRTLNDVVDRENKSKTELILSQREARGLKSQVQEQVDAVNKLQSEHRRQLADRDAELKQLKQSHQTQLQDMRASMEQERSLMKKERDSIHSERRVYQEAGVRQELLQQELRKLEKLRESTQVKLSNLRQLILQGYSRKESGVSLPTAHGNTSPTKNSKSTKQGISIRPGKNKRGARDPASPEQASSDNQQTEFNTPNDDDTAEVVFTEMLNDLNSQKKELRALQARFTRLDQKCRRQSSEAKSMKDKSAQINANLMTSQNKLAAMEEKFKTCRSLVMKLALQQQGMCDEVDTKFHKLATKLEDRLMSLSRRLAAVIRSHSAQREQTAHRLSKLEGQVDDLRQKVTKRNSEKKKLSRRNRNCREVHPLSSDRTTSPQMGHLQVSFPQPIAHICPTTLSQMIRVKKELCQDLADNFTCVLCLTNRVEMVVKPCSHACLCVQCAILHFRHTEQHTLLSAMDTSPQPTSNNHAGELGFLPHATLSQGKSENKLRPCPICRIPCERISRFFL